MLQALLLVALGWACDREDRVFRAAAGTEPDVTMSELRPGIAGDARRDAPFQDNAWAIGEGKHLYTRFNCSGCHAMGGGAIGPPLMDDEWIYGSDPQNIFATIMEGRPNGMPSFRGRIPEDRVWWLVAYVRSLSGLVPLDARPGRSDGMHVKPPEVLTDRQRPRPAPGRGTGGIP